MSHIIYQTEGIVLNKRDFGEADRMLTIYTEKFGKINVVARGIRHLKSKLKYNLETFSYSRIGLIAGREMWRVVDAEEIKTSRKIVSSSEKSIFFSKVLFFLNRMIQGEEKNIFVWNETKKLFLGLDQQNITKKELDEMEVSFLMKILHNLGYSEKDHYSDRKSSIRAINQAIKESML